MSVCFSVFQSVSVCVCVSLYLSVCASVCHCHCMCVCVCVCVCVTVCHCVCQCTWVYLSVPHVIQAPGWDAGVLKKKHINFELPIALTRKMICFSDTWHTGNETEERGRIYKQLQRQDLPYPCAVPWWHFGVLHRCVCVCFCCCLCLIL